MRLTARPVAVREAVKLLRYAIAGFGNVGSALARHVHDRADRIARSYGLDVRLIGVCDRSGVLIDPSGLDGSEIARWRESGRPIGDHPGGPSSCEPEEFFAAGIDVLVVSLPTDRHTGMPGLKLARAAIGAGAHVVLADKGPALLALPELEREAATRGLTIGASATVGSSLPTLSFARRELAGAEIVEIAAVLNGTSNVILTGMRAEGKSFREALAEAQRAGIAEPDPSYDVEGWDTAVKLTILTRALMDERCRLDGVNPVGIDGLDPEIVERARVTKGRVRLVGRSIREDDGVRMTVAPEVVGAEDAFYLVEGPRKAVRFRTDDLGDLVVSGGASGRRDVAAALLRDMLASVACSSPSNAATGDRRRDR